MSVDNVAVADTVMAHVVCGRYGLLPAKLQQNPETFDHWYFYSLELLLPAKVVSVKLSFPGTFAPRNFHYMEANEIWNFR